MTLRRTPLSVRVFATTVLLTLGTAYGLALLYLYAKNVRPARQQGVGLVVQKPLEDFRVGIQHEITPCRERRHRRREEDLPAKVGMGVGLVDGHDGLIARLSLEPSRRVCADAASLARRAVSLVAASVSTRVGPTSSWP